MFDNIIMSKYNYKLHTIFNNTKVNRIFMIKYTVLFYEVVLI